MVETVMDPEGSGPVGVVKLNADAAFGFLRSRGILTRKMTAYGLPRHLRITIGTGAEMERVAAVLGEFMAKR